MSILAATDLSDHSRHALRWASSLAASREQALVVAHVVEELADDEVWTALFDTPDDIERHVVQRGIEATRDFAESTLQDTPSPSTRQVMVAIGSAVHEVRRFADEHDVELIVAGTTGHGTLHNVLFGNTARRFTQHLHRPMAFVPAGAPLPPPRRILAALDFSACSRAALRWAAGAAKGFNAPLTVVHALGVAALSPDYEPTVNYMPNLDLIEEERRERIEELLRELGADARVVIDRGTPAQAIADLTDSEGAELLVVGTHGRGALGQLVLGSVANRILRSAKCAVVTVPEARPAD